MESSGAVSLSLLHPASLLQKVLNAPIVKHEHLCIRYLTWKDDIGAIHKVVV